MMTRIYFDYAATTPADPQVIKAMEPYFFESFGNASSPHTIGQQALKALESARETAASFIGAPPSGFIFTSGASEGNNHAMFGVAHAQRKKGKHIVISAVEHHSVLEPAEMLEQEGYHVSYVAVDAQGRISPDDIKGALTEETILVAVIHASNEIGTIQPIKQIAEITREKGVPLLVDATQTVGHISVKVEELGADLLTFSAHKFYGPKGVGGLYIKEGTPVTPLLYGGDQEKSRRASTQNVAGAVGMACAIELCKKNMEEEAREQSLLRDKLFNEVPGLIGRTKINGDLTHRLPNNAHFSFEGVEGESLLMSLDMANIAASMGSACTSGAMAASHVLRAIGLSEPLAFGSLRISLGRWNTEQEIDYLLAKLPEIVKALRV